MTEQIIYRKFNTVNGQTVELTCERQGIDFIIWNAEEWYLGNSKTIEIGLTKENWRKLKELIPTILRQ